MFSKTAGMTAFKLRYPAGCSPVASPSGLYGTDDPDVTYTASVELSSKAPHPPPSLPLPLPLPLL